MQTRTLGWRPALDGLRALAVLSVILYHYKTRPYLPGGLFGVDVFFALSGFLITTLLVYEWHNRGTISLPAFYARRFLRLAPAVLAFLAIYTTLCLVFRHAAFTQHPQPHDTWKNAAFAVTYAYSWAVALKQVVPGGFSHLWSLSVEEQYYLLWPPLLLALLSLRVRVPVVLVLVGALTFLSASMPLLAGHPSWTRAYFGADYRAHTLLIGSAAGLLFASGYVKVEHVKTLVWRACLVASCAYIGWLLFFLKTSVLYRYYPEGFPLLSAAATVIVLSAVFVDGGVWRALLGNRVIAYVGRRSYAIYLWHFPVGLAFSHFGTLGQLAAGLAVTLIVAELSYRLAESPAMRLRNVLIVFKEAQRTPTVEPPAPQLTLRETPATP